VQINVSVDTRSARLVLQQLGADVVAAEQRAINKTINAARAEAVRQIAKTLPVKAAVIRRATHVTQAVSGSPVAQLRLGPVRVPLGKLQPVQVAEGVTYRVPGRGMETALKAFIARMPTRHVGVFRRKTRKPERRGRNRSWLPIQEVPGVLVPPRVPENLPQFAQERFSRHLAVEVEQLLKRRI
jgi:hypothetical protein